MADIDGESIHFIHVRSDREDAIPLLALHGWPGTVVELIDLIRPLTAPDSAAEPAFHVVIPSHPGTGLSGPTTQPGWGVDRTARAYAALMAELHYPSYRQRHLANVLLSWLTRTATSTANNVYAGYHALFANPAAFTNAGIPTAVIAFAEDASIRRFAEAANTIVRWTDVEDCGHFAALEQPDELVEDLRTFAAD